MFKNYGIWVMTSNKSFSVKFIQQNIFMKYINFVPSFYNLLSFGKSACVSVSRVLVTSNVK